MIDIHIMGLISLRSAIKLEAKGLKRRGPSATSIAKDRYGFDRKQRISRDQLIDLLTDEIDGTIGEAP